MQFFTVTLLLVALAQSNAQSGSGGGGGLDGALQKLQTALSDADIEGAGELVDSLEESLASGGLLGILFSVLPILVQIVLGIFGDVTVGQLLGILSSLGAVLESSNSDLFEIVGSVLGSVGGLLKILLTPLGVGSLSLGR